jgi:trk system potassium uptake protein TrkH
LGGAGVVAAFEWTNPTTLGPLPIGDKVTNALFLSVTPRSAGFSTVDMTRLRVETDAVTVLQMFIGAASGSTAGGIKVNTLAILALVVVATAARRTEPEAFGRRITIGTISRAVTVLVVSFAAVALGTLLVILFSHAAASAVAFETVSAFGTVGLSLVGTARFDDPARLVLAACMFLGRLGPLALVILLFGRVERSIPVRRPAEEVRVG